jgi:putative nucleotidyltransferase with HDIG domain
MRHVLFVDDDAEVLSAMRRTLHDVRGRWQMRFVNTSAEALTALAECPADVVVTDMRMPGLDGAQLLSQIRSTWPETVRIVLSGFADDGAALRSVPVAHQFLSKPCDAATLAATLTRACELRDRLSRPDLRQLIGGLGTLPSAPRSFAAITEALGEAEVCLDTVAAVIEQDPGCAAKLLQLVNSAFFGLPRSVTQVRQAVAYLGVSRVRDVVLAAEITASFGCSAPGLAGIAETVNSHSVAVATVARQHADAAHAHDAFIAGILHDVGRLVLATVAPEQYAPIERARRAGADLTAVETELLGAGHAEVGAYLLRLWGLPFGLIDAVARHHDVLTDDEDNPLVTAVAAADALVEQDSASQAGSPG